LDDMSNLRLPYILAAAITTIPLFGLPGHAQVNTPSQGVVCDERGRVCYDNQGLSMGLTQTYFGDQAAQNVLNQLQGGPAPQEFRLSNGVACSTVARTCWSDGWSKRMVDWPLTSQLYNRNPSGSSSAGSATPEQASGFCTLSRQGQQLFSGTCQLKKLTQANRTRFLAALGNGQTFAFVSRDSNFVIQDNTGGSWPVSFENRGTTGVFRWNDLQLIATRTSEINGSNSAGSSAGSAASNALGNAAGAALGAGIGALLNSLFR